MLFGDGNLLRLAVGGTGRGKDQVADIDAQQSVQQRDALLDVVGVIARRVAYGFAHVGERSKMYACIQIVFARDACHQLTVADLPFIERVPPGGAAPPRVAPTSE